MLAAASSDSDRAFGSLKLVLLLEAKNQDCPQPLKDYFWNVLDQAVKCSTDPKSISTGSKPEAVSLALRISTDNDLRSLLWEMNRTHSISADQAKRALEELEVSFDSGDEPAHFSREIFAAI